MCAPLKPPIPTTFSCCWNQFLAHVFWPPQMSKKAVIAVSKLVTWEISGLLQLIHNVGEKRPSVCTEFWVQPNSLIPSNTLCCMPFLFLENKTYFVRSQILCQSQLTCSDGFFCFVFWHYYSVICSSMNEATLLNVLICFVLSLLSETWSNFRFYKKNTPDSVTPLDLLLDSICSMHFK